MCGIVGAIRAHHNVVDFLTDGLKRLEYRGYDSSGIAVQTGNKITRVRRVGRVQLMENAAREKGVHGHIGIGHTRWATHGGVTEPNAHPHISGGLIAVVHNGIIENFEEERARLQGLGYTFESQTDTEVIAHSVKHEYERNGHDLFAAVEAACTRFHGAYAIGVIADDNHKEMVVARMGCPLLVAFGDEETFIASDVSAVIAFTRNIAYLEDGDIALLNANGIEKLLDKNGQAAERKVKVSELSLASLELGPYSHFMQKEIHEQPVPLPTPPKCFSMAALSLKISAKPRVKCLPASTASKSSPAALLIIPPSPANTGSRASPKSPPMWKSPANTATAM
jgi:glucosamine--fructose-6-phosphate aminotransferase (isomerizing)